MHDDTAPDDGAPVPPDDTAPDDTAPAAPAAPSSGGRPAPPAGRVTRADVARYAGVSGAVVSYVVNGGPRPVAPATRERVLHAVRALGYRPNATARALSKGSTGLLGLVVPRIDNPHFGELAVALEHAALERGYGLLLANSGSEQEAERRDIVDLASRQVDGLVLVTGLGRHDLAALPLEGIPTVLVNTFRDVEGFTSVGVDAFEGAADAVRHLSGHGHRSVALVIGEHAGDAEQRERGWLHGSRESGLVDGPIAREPFTREGGHRAGRRLFDTATPPTAVFCSSDLQALGVLHALWELGLEVPRDVAVVSFDGTADTAYLNPPLTVVEQPLAAMSRRAVALLLDPPAGGTTTTVVEPAALVLRRSCGCGPDVPRGRSLA